jgi:3-methyl-2-oxobutanoate hydroxymethyltransferase
MNVSEKVTVEKVLAMKGKRKITVLTAYDYTTAKVCDTAGIDILLVGDSAGMVMLGYDRTTMVTMDEMLLFCRAVANAKPRAMVVADMPFMSYQVSVRDAVYNACRFVKESGADAVKIEGGREVSDKVRAIVNAGIPVMGHIGLKPQTALLWQGYKVQGKSKDTAINLIEDALAIQEAGAFCIVLEQVAYEVAEIITNRLRIPTIGIGSGLACDGQVLVIHDMLGLYSNAPRFAKRYANIYDAMLNAVISYKEDVINCRFPSKEHEFHMSEQEYNELLRELKISMVDKHE